MNVLPSWVFVFTRCVSSRFAKSKDWMQRGKVSGLIIFMSNVDTQYSSGLICDTGWPFLFFWHDILHNGCDANLRILKWKPVILSVSSFSWAGSLRLIWCTKKENVRNFRKDSIQFCTVYQQKGGDVNKAQLHGCLSSKNYISSF